LHRAGDLRGDEAWLRRTCANSSRREKGSGQAVYGSAGNELGGTAMEYSKVTGIESSTCHKGTPDVIDLVAGRSSSSAASTAS